MIVKFLYQMNVKNKRILTGLIEDDNQVIYDSMREIPMVLEDNVVLKDNERKISNFGELYYCVFKEDNNYKYLNINDYMLKVKVNASDVVAFASFLTKEMIESILYNTSYLDCEYDLKYIYSGYKLLDTLEYDDSYRVFFKNVEDDVYVEFLDEETPKFLTFVDGKYDFVSDFSKAMRVYKKEVRNLLLTHEYITKSTKKADAAMSHENVFTKSPLEYIFAGENSFLVTFVDSRLKIQKNPKLTSEFRLANDQTRSQILRNILYTFKKPENKETRVLRINDLYIVKNGDLDFSLTNEASQASNITIFEVELIKNAIQLFTREPKIEELNSISSHTYYLYNTDKNYSLTDALKKEKSTIVDQSNAINFYKAFEGFNNQGNIIIKSNDKYIKIEFNSKEDFSVSYLENGLNASRFSEHEVAELEKLLNKKFQRREISPMNAAYLRINESVAPSLEEQYNAIIREKNNTNIRFGSVLSLDKIRITSDKGAFEYYESLFMKSYLDSYKLFSKVLQRTSNVLLVGTTSNIDLTALSAACDKLNKEVNVTILDTTKWGYYPNSYISKNVKLENVYRLELTSLPYDFIKKFDLIFIGKTYKNTDDLVKFIEDLKESDYEGFILNESLNEEYGFTSEYDNALHLVYNYQRRLISHEDTPIGASILDNKLSHYSILRIKNKQVKDALKSK